MSFQRLRAYIIIIVVASGCPMAYGFELTILSYNTWLRPANATVTINGIVSVHPFNDDQLARAKLMPAKLDGSDVVALNEVFDEASRNAISADMRARGYEKQTSVLGDTAGRPLNGGVMVFTRGLWAMVSSEQLYKSSGGADQFAAKGFIYAVLRRPQNGVVHLFATHAQATGNGFEGWLLHNMPEEARGIRRQQFSQLSMFIKSQNIPANEPVIIAGDLNVNRANSAEYTEMLDLLEVNPSKTSNQVTTPGGEFLDYILFSRNHKQPRAATQETLQFKNPIGEACEQLAVPQKCTGLFGIPLPPAACGVVMKKACRMVEGDLSDHHPVLGRLSFE